MFQAFNLVPSLDATENVMAPMTAAGIPAKQARARANDLLGQVGLTERAHHHPGDMRVARAEAGAWSTAPGPTAPMP